MKVKVDQNALSEENSSGVLVKKASKYYEQWDLQRENFLEAVSIDVNHWQNQIATNS